MMDSTRPLDEGAQVPSTLEPKALWDLPAKRGRNQGDAMQRRARLESLVEAVVGAALLCGVSFLLQWRYQFGLTDEGWLWYVSQRTALGELPLRDFFSYDPGRYYWTALFFFLTDDTGFRSVMAAAAAFGAVGLSVVWYTMSSAGLGLAWRSGCAVALALALGYPPHKSYESALSMILVASICLVLRGPDSVRRWVVLGVSTGVAGFFGRNSGAFYGLSALACAATVGASRGWRTLGGPAGGYVAGVLLGYSPMIGLSLGASGFARALFDSVFVVPIRPMSVPIPFWWRLELSGLSAIDQLQRIAVATLFTAVPSIYVAGLLSVWNRRRRRSPRCAVSTLLEASCIAGIPYLLQAFSRADFPHISQSSPPAIVAVTALLYLAWHRRRRRPAAAVATLMALCLFVAAWLPFQPAIRVTRAMRATPGAFTTHRIAGREFVVPTWQADLLTTLAYVVRTCAIGPNEFMTAPLLIGAYPYLNARAPFWELYYIYRRDDAMQRAHIAALAKTRLLMLSSVMAVDGLQERMLPHTYPLLMLHVRSHYEPLTVRGLPSDVILYASPGACPRAWRPVRKE